jgi:hypothetical protein
VEVKVVLTTPGDERAQEDDATLTFDRRNGNLWIEFQKGEATASWQIHNGPNLRKFAQILGLDSNK